jgi:DNA-binding CsgD family transcriptional regulator
LPVVTLERKENDMKRYARTVPTGVSAMEVAVPAPPEPPSRGTRKITPRELEVLALIADGYSTREIARSLWITEETVRTHVRRLLDRLNARTRAQAVSIAYRDSLWTHRDREAS